MDLILQRAAAAAVSLVTTFNLPSRGDLFYLLHHKPAKPTVAKKQFFSAMKRKKSDSACTWNIQLTVNSH